MKTISIFFVVIWLSAWVPPIAYAGPSPAKPPASENLKANVPPPDVKQDHRGSKSINNRIVPVRIGAAAIGGPVTARKAAAINGTVMSHKP